MKKLLTTAVAAVAIATLGATAQAASAAAPIKLVAGPFSTKAKCVRYLGSNHDPDLKCQYFQQSADGELSKGWYVREY
ncbi:hypothetical protein ABZW18_01745 [Streptomyces sp. NPDC004647]|uniref:hypothetical protein n=1 Tax=Streptomyces sp. NPDC004647 TaxID=3154671 RepID=UPI0033A17062